MTTKKLPRNAKVLVNIPSSLSDTRIGKFPPNELEKVQIQIKAILTKWYGVEPDNFYILDK